MLQFKSKVGYIYILQRLGKNTKHGRRYIGALLIEQDIPKCPWTAVVVNNNVKCSLYGLGKVEISSPAVILQINRLPIKNAVDCV